jgi:hypothetical protein
MIAVQCICGKRFKAKDDQRGRTFPCPQCGHPNRNVSRLTLFASLASLLMSSACVAWNLVHRNPLGKGLRSYDFSTPEKAMRSHLQISANHDVRALIELASIESDAEAKLKSLKVHKQAEYRGRKILFVSFDKDGVGTHDIEGFEKHADTGFWFPRATYSFDIEDQDLKKSIQEWKEKPKD